MLMGSWTEKAKRFSRHLFFVLLILAPFGLWKIAEIVLWIVYNVRLVVH